MIKLGLVGCGSVGKNICENMNKLLDDYVLYVYDRHLKKRNRMGEISNRIKVCDSIDEILNSDIDFLIESASRSFLKETGASFLKKGISIISLSNGVLVEEDVKRFLIEAAREGNSKIYLPGTPPGIDTVLAMQVCGVTSAKYKSLRSLKHPLAQKFGEGDYFEGNVRQAMQVFKTSLNTSASLAEASLGYNKTEVEVSFHSYVEGYKLQTIVSSEIGDLTVTLEGSLDESSGKFTILAAVSVIALLNKLNSRIVIGI